MKPKEIFWSGLKGGIFEQKHYRAIGSAIWLFGYLCMRQSQVNESGEGLPHYGNALTDAQLHADTGWPLRTIEYWRKKLTRAGYIHTVRDGNLGLVYFIHKAKQKAKNPKPSTRYFAAELQPDGRYRKVSQKSVPPKAQVSQKSVGTVAKICTTYADNPSENQSDTQITNTLIPKHLNYNTESLAKDARLPLPVLIKKAARELQPPRQMSQPELDARRRELLLQGEKLKARFPTNGNGLGLVSEATA